jgi:hypothetical protein
MKKKKVTKRQRKAASANNAMVDSILHNSDSKHNEYHGCSYVGNEQSGIPFIRVS